MRSIRNVRILVINCPKELVVREPSAFQGNYIDIVRIDPDSKNGCLDHTSTLNFIDHLNERLLNEDTGNFVVYLIRFKNMTAMENFRNIVNSLYPDNLIEFIDNPYFQNIYDVISSYLYLLKIISFLLLTFVEYLIIDNVFEPFPVYDVEVFHIYI